MAITSRKLTAEMLVIPNSVYFFGPKEKLDSDPFEIVCNASLEKVAHVYFTRVGAIGIDFDATGPLGSIDVLEFKQNGMIPEIVTENENQIVLLQVRRIEFMNFVSAALFGKISALQHTSLIGANVARLDKIYGFKKIGTSLSFAEHEAPQLTLETSEKLRALAATKNQLAFLPEKVVEDASLFVVETFKRAAKFQHADLPSTMAMNYQGAILHNQQVASASFALNFAVAECLVNELFYAYGLLDGEENKAFTSISFKANIILKIQFSKMNMATKVDHLKKCGLLTEYLFGRIDAARIARNHLMHRGTSLTPKQSGECQTIVRDLWMLLLDQSFELISGWTYRY